MTNTVLMIILLAMPDGSTQATFADYESLAVCEEKKQIVSTIMSTSRNKVSLLECRKSTDRFEPFVHKFQQQGKKEEEKDRSVYYYQLKVEPDAVFATPVKNLTECKPNATDSATIKEYCVQSAQKKLN